MAGRFGIIGCGYVGSAVALHMRNNGIEVTGTTTSPDRLGELCAVVDHPRIFKAGDPSADTSFLAQLDGRLIAMDERGASGSLAHAHAWPARGSQPQY